MAIREADEPIHHCSHQCAHEQLASHRVKTPNQHRLCMEGREVSLWVLYTREGDFGPHKYGWYHGIHDFLQKRHRKFPGWHRKFFIFHLTFPCLIVQIPAQILVGSLQFFVSQQRRNQLNLDEFLMPPPSLGEPASFP